MKKKVCMLGAFAVGKTSLVQQYVNSIFNERYQTTLGVKIDRKSLTLDGQSLELMLWDLAGEDDYLTVRSSYLRGSAGALLVADGTRPETLDVALSLAERVTTEVGQVPMVLCINKVDLHDQWVMDQARLDALVESGWCLVKTSARDGKSVEGAFQLLGERLVAQ